MEEIILTVGQSQGVWALLFIFMLIHQLKENKQTREDSIERENKLINFLNEMSANYERLTSQYTKLAEDVDYIKVKVAEKSSKDT